MGKANSSLTKKGKRSHDQNDRFNKIPEFGKASGDARILLFDLTQLSEPNNPYRNKRPKQIERNNVPGVGNMVPMPDTNFVAARMRHDQLADQDLCRVHHNAHSLVPNEWLY